MRIIPAVIEAVPSGIKYCRFAGPVREDRFRKFHGLRVGLQRVR